MYTLFLFYFYFIIHFFNMQEINELKSKEKEILILIYGGYLPPSCMLLSVFSTAVRTKDGQTAYPSCGSVGSSSARSQREFV
jgi:hypothetical protein